MRGSPLPVARDPFQVLEEDEEMERVGGRRREIESLVPLTRSMVLRVDSQGANTSDVRGLKCAQDRISKERLTNAAALPFPVYRQASEKHDRDRMASEALAEPLRRVSELDLADGEAVEAGDGAIHQADISLCGVRELVLEGVPDQPQVEVGLTAVEGIQVVFFTELLDDAGFVH
jgi:hypothetical protein